MPAACRIPRESGPGMGNIAHAQRCRVIRAPGAATLGPRAKRALFHVSGCINLVKMSANPDARFWDRIARRYARKPVGDQQAYETKLAKTDSYLKSTDRVLDIGCGTGTTAIHHAPKVAHIRATDISGKMIGIAREKARAAGVANVDFEVSGVDEINADADSFDVVLAHSILHLLPDVEGTLVRLHRMLKPGGLLVSTTACLGDFMPLFRYVGPLGRALGVMPRVNVFREADLARWLAEAGFDVEYRWLPKPKSGVYLVARKAAGASRPP